MIQAPTLKQAVLITGMALSLITSANAGLPVAPRPNAKPASISGSNVNAGGNVRSTMASTGRAGGLPGAQATAAAPGPAATRNAAGKGSNNKGPATHS